MIDCNLCAGIDLHGHLGRPPSGSDFDRVLERGPGVVLTPTVGMLMAGYLLVVTQAHVLSFGALGSEYLHQELSPWLRGVIERITPVFGEYIVFEHGSASEDERHGGCVVHAHLHLIPGGRALRDDLLVDTRWIPVTGLGDCSDVASRGYAFMSDGSRAWMIVAPGFPGQWIRRAAARQAGCPDAWDWGVFRGDKQLNRTLQLFPSNRATEGP